MRLEDLEGGGGGGGCVITHKLLGVFLSDS